MTTRNVLKKCHLGGRMALIRSHHSRGIRGKFLVTSPLPLYFVLCLFGPSLIKGRGHAVEYFPKRWALLTKPTAYSAVHFLFECVRFFLTGSRETWLREKRNIILSSEVSCLLLFHSCRRSVSVRKWKWKQLTEARHKDCACLSRTLEAPVEEWLMVWGQSTE